MFVSIAGIGVVVSLASHGSNIFQFGLTGRQFCDSGVVIDPHGWVLV